MSESTSPDHVTPTDGPVAPSATTTTPPAGHVPDSSLEQELRVASDNFLTRVERLHALEERKRSLPSDELAGIAQEVETLAVEVLAWAGRQRELASAAAADDAPDAPPIAIIPARRLDVVLEDWRAAERRLGGETPNTAEWESARADVERLREEYARAYYEQTRAERPG